MLTDWILVQEFDVENKNGRLYPSEGEVKQKLLKLISDGRCLGYIYADHLDIPKDPPLIDVSHVVREYQETDSAAEIKIEILDTEMGKNLQTLFDQVEFVPRLQWRWNEKREGEPEVTRISGFDAVPKGTANKLIAFNIERDA